MYINPTMGGSLTNGTDTTEAKPVAQDVFGFSLHYYRNDYRAIWYTPQASSVIGALTTNAAPLYNGNIAAMAVNIPRLSNTKVYNYKYDQLNRLVAMDLFNGLNPVAGTFTASVSTEYQERISYDPNGNIRTYQRNGDAARLSMDNLTYSYKPNTNQLHKVVDAATDATAGVYPNYNDLRTGQADNNYVYDAIGNLVQDAKDTITNITWNVYGKIESITKNAKIIRYTYDASGNRISKATTTDTTFYVRDASGNVLSVYSKPAGGPITQDEVHLYGSSRLGMTTRHVAADTNFNAVGAFGKIIGIKFTRGEKLFELSNHLGNVLVTVADRVVQVKVTSDTVRHYLADVRSANDYYPFGMQMPGRKFNAGGFRYGFNGKENDNEISGSGNQYDYGFRIYNSRIGRFLSVDPLTQSYPWYTPYQFAGNKPIWAIDLDGLEEALPQQPATVPVIRMASESTCIGYADIAKALAMHKMHADLERLRNEYNAWRSGPGNIGKPLPPQYEKVAAQASSNATFSQGGYLGTPEYKIAKARYDLYGKYLPGVSDIDDGLTMIGELKDGNYKAAAFSALFFLPGGDFLKPLKNLKGAGKLGGSACMDYAKDFMSKYGKKIGEAGGTVKKMEIKMGSGVIGAGLGAESKQLSSIGLHQFVEVTDKSGAVKIFDNPHPEGILKSDYLKSLSGSNVTDGVMDGAKLYEKYAKEAIK